VRLELALVGVRVGLERLPLLGFRVNKPDGVTQRAVVADRFAELLGQLSEHVLLRQIAASLFDLVSQGFGETEMLEQSHDVGKRFMEGENVGIGPLRETRVQAIEQGVRGLVGDNVMRQTGENDPTRQILARVGPGSWEIAE
jgi:hypothetical protein